MTTSPRRNRVTPTGEIVAVPLRCAWLGNRGILHDDDGNLRRHHATNAWITCRLEFRDWRLPQWQPHHFTVLFLHDEAVSLAAGHRPCALCRRTSYRDFLHAISGATGENPLRAKELDQRLHHERLLPRTSTRRLHPALWADVPDLAFVVQEGRPTLVLADRLVPWTTAGYGAPRPRPRAGSVDVLTPPTLVAALRGGYRPQVDAVATG